MVCSAWAKETSKKIVEIYFPEGKELGTLCDDE